MANNFKQICFTLLILFAGNAMAATCGGGAKEYLKLNPNIMANNYNDIIGKLYDPDSSVDAKEIINNAVNEHFQNEGYKTGSCSPFSPPETCDTENCCNAYYPNVKCPKATQEDDTPTVTPLVIPKAASDTSTPTSDPVPDSLEPDL